MTTDAPESATPQPPDLSRKTLTPIGYTIVAVIPILIAAIGFTILHFNYNPEDVVTGTRVPIMTSAWRDGDAGGSDTIEGVLSLGSDECVHLTTPDGTDLSVVWPFDFEATYDPPTPEQPDRLKLYDTDRTIAARAGDTIRAQGTLGDVGQYVGQTCAPPSGTQVAFVQSPIVITARG